MFKLTKRTDYALIALHHMASLRAGEVSSAKEIAAIYHIPLELLAKILQRLVKKELIMSLSGPKGGYCLARRPCEITMGEVVRTTEGEVRITRCNLGGVSSCIQTDRCTVRTPLRRIQESIVGLLECMTLEEMIHYVQPEIKLLR